MPGGGAHVTAAVVALGMAVALLGVLVVGLLRSHADILRALHELGVGDEQLAGAARARAAPISAPTVRTVAGVPEPGDTSALGRLVDIDGLAPDGGAVRVGLAGARGMTLLAFLSSGCSTCLDFWRAFATDEVERVPGRDTRVVVVTKGPEDESPSSVAELAPDRVVTVMSSRAWDDYGVPVSPYFLLLDGTSGVVGEGAGASWAQVVDLLGKAVADAGMQLDAGARLTRRDLLRGGDREQRADRELAAAGIEPGSPDLYRPVTGPDDEDPLVSAPVDDEEPLPVAGPADDAPWADAPEPTS